MKLLSVALAVIALALSGASAFYLGIELPRERALLAEQRANLQMQLAALQTEQARIQAQPEKLTTASTDTQQTVERIEAARKALEATQAEIQQHENYEQDLSLALAPASNARVAVAESAQINMVLCGSNAECGLEDALSYANKSIKSLTVESGGIIVVLLTERFPVAQARIEFRPAFDPQEGGPSNFSCATNLPREDTQLKDCEAL